jgi:hypothetical protein
MKTKESNINCTTPLTENVLALIEQLQLIDLVLLVFTLVGGKSRHDLSRLIARLRKSAKWDPLLDYFYAQNINLLAELERSILSRLPYGDEAVYLAIKHIGDCLSTNKQHWEFPVSVTYRSLWFLLVQLRYSIQLREMIFLSSSEANNLQQNEDSDDRPGF